MVTRVETLAGRSFGTGAEAETGPLQPPLLSFWDGVNALGGGVGGCVCVYCLAAAVHTRVSPPPVPHPFFASVFSVAPPFRSGVVKSTVPAEG